MQAPPNSHTFRRLVHDVPVTIIPIREWSEYQLPELLNYDVRASTYYSQSHNLFI